MKKDNVSLNHEQDKISEYLEKVRFRKRFFGGVSEQDVWKKISELNKMYEAALSTERARYDTMIDHYRKTGINKKDGEMTGDKRSHKEKKKQISNKGRI